jgi:hypothetical protein
MRELINDGIVHVDQFGDRMEPVVWWSGSPLAVSDGIHINSYEELDDLHSLYKKAGWSGMTVWIAKKNNHLPYRFIVDCIREEGKIDIDALGLPPNRADDYVDQHYSEFIQDWKKAFKEMSSGTV